MRARANDSDESASFRRAASPLSARWTLPMRARTSASLLAARAERGVNVVADITTASNTVTFRRIEPPPGREQAPIAWEPEAGPTYPIGGIGPGFEGARVPSGGQIRADGAGTDPAGPPREGR